MCYSRLPSSFSGLVLKYMSVDIAAAVMSAIRKVTA